MYRVNSLLKKLNTEQQKLLLETTQCNRILYEEILKYNVPTAEKFCNMRQSYIDFPDHKTKP